MFLWEIMRENLALILMKSQDRYIALADLEKEMKENPNHFTEWFKIILSEYKKNLVVEY